MPPTPAQSASASNITEPQNLKGSQKTQASQIQQASQDPSSLPLPELRNDLIIYETTSDDTGQPRWHIFDTSRNRYFMIGYSAYQMFLAWPTAKNVGQLVRRVNRLSAQKITPAEAVEMMRFLQTSQLFVSHTQTAINSLMELLQKSKTNPIKKVVHGYLFFRIPLWHPDKFLDKSIKFVAPFFSSIFWMLTLALAIVSVYLTSKQFDVYLNYLLDFFSLEGIAVYGAFLVLAKVMHELGHAYSAKHFGCEVPTIGVAFLVMWPVLYTDGSALWRLRSRRQKLLINFAGIIVESWLAIICLFLWNVLPDGVLRSAMFVMSSITITGTLLINLNIFMRFDGYYILLDLLGIENLQLRSFVLAKWKIRKWIFGIELEKPEAYSTWHHNFMIFYAMGIWIYRFFLFLGIAFLVYYLFFKVLGIALFIVEIVYFIAKPIYNEILVWWKMREKITWNFQTKRSTIILALIVLALIIPWQSEVKAPAVIERQQSAIVHTPLEGSITAVLVKEGDIVTRDQILIKMSSPTLEAAIEIEEINLNSTNIMLKRTTASANALEQLQVLAHERQQRQAKLSALKEQRDSLEIKSPVNGQIVSLSDGLAHGIWVSKNIPLIQIVSTDNSRAISFVEEKDIRRIKQGANATFFPESSSFGTIKLNVIRIDSNPVNSLEIKEMASRYGGEIPVRENISEALVPTQALYRVLLATKKPDTLPFVTSGRVFISAERSSPIVRFFKFFASILIRESGF